MSAWWMDDNISLLEFQSRIGIPIIIFNLGTAKYVQGYYITKNYPLPPDTRGGEGNNRRLAVLYCENFIYLPHFSKKNSNFVLKIIP